MTTPPRHRHEMTLRIGGNDNDELVRRLRRVADDIELHDIDGPREVVSSDGYWFTTKHDPSMTPERYRVELQAWAERKRALASEWTRDADDALNTIREKTRTTTREPEAKHQPHDAAAVVAGHATTEEEV